MTFTIDGLDPVEVVTQLRQRHQPVGHPADVRPAALTEPVLRASPHYLTTQTEIHALGAALRDLAAR